jgi:cytochrome c biogenesis protein CcmG, thiol:disulfide interchange protein DsbE
MALGRALRLSAQTAAVALVLALLALLVWRVTHSGGRPTHGPAPHFTLPRLDGKGALALADFRGKGIVINFAASWCDPCKQEAPALERTWRRYRSRGLVVLGVDGNDFTSDARKFTKRYGLTYPFVRDPDGGILRKYGLDGFPETFFVDRNGRLVGEHIEGPINEGENVKLFEQGLALALAERS